MYIKGLRLDNLRSFDLGNLELQYPGRSDGAVEIPNVNLVLGDNGAGKSTILKAIALGVLSPALAKAGSGFRAYRLVRFVPWPSRMPTRDMATIATEVVLHSDDTGTRDTIDEKLRTYIRRFGDEEVLQFPPDDRHENVRTLPSARIDHLAEYWDNLFEDASPAFFVVGYGADRRIENSAIFDESARRRRLSLRFQRVAGLFDEPVTLVPLHTWLPQLQNDRGPLYGQVKALLESVLPDEVRFSDKQLNNDSAFGSAEYVFQVRGVPVPFGALSDGYRAYIGWLADLLYHLSRGASDGTDLRERRGIVLVDEIDLHLHPEWQRTVVPRLAKALPNLQFVFTTHSPIVTGTLQSENIFVTEVDDQGTSTVTQFHERVHGLSAEQVLLSSYFGMDTTRAEAAEDELAALARRAEAGDREAALAYLKALRNGTVTAGSTTNGVPASDA